MAHMPRPIPLRLCPITGPQTHLLGEPVFVPLNYPTVKYVWGNDDDFMFYVSWGWASGLPVSRPDVRHSAGFPAAWKRLEAPARGPDAEDLHTAECPGKGNCCGTLSPCRAAGPAGLVSYQRLFLG